MADYVKSEVHAYPAGPQASYYFTPARQPDTLSKLVEGLSRLQPSLRRYAEAKEKVKDKELTEQAIRDYAEGKEPTSQERAYVDAYNKFDAHGDLVDFQVDLAKFLEENKEATPEEFLQSQGQILKQYTEDMPPGYLEKFIPGAIEAMGRNELKHRSYVAEQVKTKTLENASKIIRGRLEGILEAPASKDNGKVLRGMLDEIVGDAKALGVNTQEVAALFLNVVSETAELEGRPDLMEYVFEKDKAGIKTVDTALRDDALASYKRAEAARDRRIAEAEAARAKWEARMQKVAANNLLISALELDGTDVEGIRKFERMVAGYADPRTNPHGIMLPFSQVNSLLSHAERLKDLNGFPERSDPELYKGAYIAAFEGDLDVSSLNVIQDGLNEKDNRELLKLMLEANKNRTTEGYEEWKTDEQDTWRALKGILNPEDALGRSMEPEGPQRVKEGEYIWKKNIRAFIQENERFPTLDEMYEISERVEKHVMKRIPRMMYGPDMNTPVLDPSAQKQYKKMRENLLKSFDELEEGTEGEEVTNE